jgi:hypothetical protein
MGTYSMSKAGEKAIRDRTSDPIPNAFNGGVAEYYAPMRVVFQRIHDDIQPWHDGASVEWLTRKLGKRSFLWSGSRRYHVWERENYRVFAAREHGMSVEYFPGPSTEGSTQGLQSAAKAAMDDFLRDVGLMEDVTGPDSEVHSMPASVGKELLLKMRAAVRAHRDAKRGSGAWSLDDEALWEILHVPGPYGSWVREGVRDPSTSKG